jgi:hypothetical protein
VALLKRKERKERKRKKGGGKSLEYNNRKNS